MVPKINETELVEIERKLLDEQRMNGSDDAGSDYHDYYDELYTFLSNLTSWQHEQLDKVDQKGKECFLTEWMPPAPQGRYCNATWDEFICWPHTAGGTRIERECPMKCDIFKDTPAAIRTCLPNGAWERGNWTNYTLCFEHAVKCSHYDPKPNVTISSTDEFLADTMKNIFFYGSILSLVLLITSLIIFSAFRSLHCQRISIHKNLVASFILRYMIVVVLFEPFITEPNGPTYREVSWLCKFLVVLHYYAMQANIFWMFVEGLSLYNRLAVSVLHPDAKFITCICYFIGWGLPAVFIAIFAVCLHFFHPEKCWDGNTDEPYAWIVFVPIMLALVVNAFFLVKIIAILVTKLTANNSFEITQLRKAVKATTVLLPLLGTTNLLFFLKPESNVASQIAYRIVNSTMQVSQGIFVSVIYCFMNGEVQSALRKKWERFRLRKLDGIRGRRRSSRTSSFFLSQSEVTSLMGRVKMIAPSSKRRENRLSSSSAVDSDDLLEAAETNSACRASTESSCVGCILENGHEIACKVMNEKACTNGTVGRENGEVMYVTEQLLNNNTVSPIIHSPDVDSNSVRS